MVHSVYRPQTAHPLYAGKRLQRTVLGEGGLRPPSQILALRVYNMPTVSTISRPRPPVVHSVYRPQTAHPLYAGKRLQRTVLGEGGLRPPYQILALRVYNMPTVSTISRPRLLVVHIVYRPQTAHPLCAGKRWQRTVLGEGGLRPPSQILALRVYNMPTVFTISLQCIYVCVCVCIYIYIHTCIYIYMSYDTVRRVVLCRTVSYSVVQCRTVSYCVVLCRTVSYCVVLCRTVSYCVVQCIHTYIYIHIYVVRHCTTRRTVSYCVVLCRTVSYCVVQCRTVSYCVVLCRTVSYCVVLCRTVSYCVVVCRTSVVRHSTTRRTVSYSVVQCRTVSYSVVQCRTTLYDASYCVVQGVGARRVGSVRRVVQCRTRRRGPTRRGCTTRRTVWYKVSYSTDTVRHSTTQYDTVRHSTTQYDTIRHGTTQYDTVRHNTTQYDTVRHGTTQYDTVRRVVQCRTRCRTAPTPYHTVRHSTTQYDTVRHSTTQYDTVRHSTTRYDTVRHSTTQYDTVRHSTTRYVTHRHIHM